MATLALAGLWTWQRIEDTINAVLERRVEPIKAPEEPTYLPSRDVSVVVPTINTPDDFCKSMHTWLAADPLEIIVVTIPRDAAHVSSLIHKATATFGAGGNKVRLETVNEANKRRQLAHGIRLAKGKILCFADDDVIWNSMQFLSSMLACFEDPQVGGAGGRQMPSVSEDRRDPDIISPWEVAAMKRLSGPNGDQAAVAAVEGDLFILAGRTALYRREVVQDDAFLHAFTHDYWAGQLLNSGDDVFCTRWTQDHGWKIAVQSHKDASLAAHIHPDANLARQLVRWERNTTRTHIRSMTETGRAWKSFRNARSIIWGYFLKPILAIVQVALWVQIMRTRPLVGFGFAAAYVFDVWLNLGAFVEKYPYCVNNIWAAFLIDRAYLFTQPYAWWTLNNVGWLTRDSSSDEPAVGIFGTKVGNDKAKDVPEHGEDARCFGALDDRPVPESDAEMRRRLEKFFAKETKKEKFTGEASPLARSLSHFDGDRGSVRDIFPEYREGDEGAESGSASPPTGGDR